MAESEPCPVGLPLSTPGKHGSAVSQAVADKLKAVFYGQCIGDALGIMTEYLTKEEAKQSYGKNPKSLKYEQKISDFHRDGWKSGDWTDDTDQMIMILQSLLYNKGEIVVSDFAERMKRWKIKGFPELGKFGCMGIGRLTKKVLEHPLYATDPQKVANEVWEANERKIASNGGVMRTSILGLHQWEDIEKVVDNALCFVKCTHFDPRCQASVVAVSSCIAKMIQHTAQRDTASKKLLIDDIIQQSYDLACRVLENDDQKKELWQHMSCKKIKKLALTESGKVGYTYKCMGSGFWALRQDNFEKAMIELVMEGGDADTNGAVAGAMLACKLGLEAIPDHWISDLRHGDLILDLYIRFIRLQSEMSIPVEQRTSNDDLSLESLDLLGQQYQEKVEKLRQDDKKECDAQK